MKTRLEFFLQPGQHLLIGSHPHQSVDGDTFFTSSERRIEKIDKILHSHRNRDSLLLQYFDRSLYLRQIHCPQLLLCCIKERSKGCFQTEGDARVSTNHIIRNASHLLHHLTNLSQGHLIFRFGIATEIRERSTLSHSLYSRHFIRGESEIITVSRGINPTRRACRLLEVERALRDFYLIHSLYIYISIQLNSSLFALHFPSPTFSVSIRRDPCGGREDFLQHRRYEAHSRGSSQHLIRESSRY